LQQIAVRTVHGRPVRNLITASELVSSAIVSAAPTHYTPGELKGESLLQGGGCV